MSALTKIKLITFNLIVLVVITGCETTGTSQVKDKSELGEDYGVLLTYSERERAGTPLFKSQMFVNKNYLYISDERSPDDFLLFNRANKTIYSVTHANKTVFVIKPKEVKGAPPIKIDYVAKSQPSSAIPKVSGRIATHYQYSANGSQCYDAVTLEKSFLNEVVGVIKEYRQVLAGEHASTVHSMPMDTHDACDLALNIYHATQHLDTGLPMREWDQKGFLKFMINYQRNYKMDVAKFEIPKDYNEFSVGK
ncbi:hypothetical protein [Kaarinaea lacus]